MLGVLLFRHVHGALLLSLPCFPKFSKSYCFRIPKAEQLVVILQGCVRNEEDVFWEMKLIFLLIFLDLEGE